MKDLKEKFEIFISIVTLIGSIITSFQKDFLPIVLALAAISIIFIIRIIFKYIKIRKIIEKQLATEIKGFKWALSYNYDYKDCFYGRNNDISQIVSIIRNNNQDIIRIIYGESGTGKTSIIQAGVIPKIENDFKYCYISFNELPQKISTCDELFEYLLKYVNTRISIYRHCEEYSTKQSFF